MQTANQRDNKTAERFGVPPSSFSAQWDAVPADAPCIIDFDETLWLSNSTEDYLASARPAWGAAWVLLLLELAARILRRLPNGAHWIDPLRVGVITLLFPGTLRRWRADAPRRVATDFNTELWEQLGARGGALVLASLGFRRIIEPLLAASPAQGLPLIACNFGPAGARQRQMGKLGMIDTVMGADARASAAALTDSEQDAALLEGVKYPFLVRWPKARYQRAGDCIYLPLRYVTRVKHPGEHLVRRVLLMEDFALWWLATVFAATQPVIHTLGLLLLLLSFWCVYERGYAENDRVARRHEREGKLGPSDNLAIHFDRPVQGWCWALVFGALGTFLVAPSTWSVAIAAWVVMLLALRLAYWLYNYSNKPARLWIYLLLQMFRGLAPLAVMSLGTAGVLAGLALALSRWMPYFAYRTQGGTYQHEMLRPVRFVIWALMLVALWWGAGLSIEPWPAAAISLWLGLLAATRLRGMVRGWRSIRHDRLP